MTPYAFKETENESISTTSPGSLFQTSAVYAKIDRLKEFIRELEEKKH